MSKEMREQINKVKNFGQFLNENFTKGDLVKLKYDIKRNEEDGEYGYSIDVGEIGEIRYITPSTENERDENKVYMVKFSDDKDKQGSLSKGRYIQLTKNSFVKVGG
jgi:hypothetical protein